MLRITPVHVAALFLIVFLLFGVSELVENPAFTGAIVLPPSGNLSCQFVELANASCPGGFTKIYGMSAQENAHAELPNESNYNISVCCQDLASANQIGIGSDGTGVINISNFTNAHAELTTEGNYDVPVFINASNASIGCSVNLTGEGSCPAQFACMGTLSNETNGHVSNCTSAGRYNITVCCSIGALITVYVHPNTAPTNNLTANGSINGTLIDTTETSYETQDILFFNASDSDKRFLLIRGLFNVSTVDASALVVEFNASAVAVNVSGVSGDLDNHTLFLANNANNLGVHVCPDADSLSEMGVGCSGETNFTLPFPQTIGNVTVLVDGSDYRVENVSGSAVELLTSINASLTNSPLVNATAQNSVLVDSPVSNGAVSDSTLTNTTVINSTVSSSNKTNSSIINSTVTGSTNLNCTLVNVTETQSSCLNSSVENSTLTNITVINATIANEFCTSGVLIFNGQTFMCPIALATVYASGGGGSGGGGGSSAGAAAAAAAAASTSTSTAAAAAAAASTASQASLSVQAALSTAGLGQCQTVVPKVTSERPDIPRGFALLGKPDFTCFGNIADFTINVPDEYEDLRAIRCRGGVCQEVEDTSRAYDDLLCGDETVRSLRDAERERLRPNVTVEVPIAVESDRYFSDSNPRTIIGPYEIDVKGRFPPRFTGRLHLATGEIPLPPNPQVILLNPPLQATVGDAEFHMRVNVTVPLVSGIDLGTLTIAVYQDGQWVLLGGEYENGTNGADSVSIQIDHVGQYADADGLVTFGLLGVVCEACTRGELVRDYTDGSSRRALILVHGLTAHAMKFGTLIDDFRLNNQPWQVWTFRYPYDRSIEANAQELRDLIALHSEEFDEVYVLGHSLGGLIAQQALWDSYQQQQSGVPVPWLAEVKRAIIIGTPNRGSPTADVYRQLLSNLFNLSSSASPFDVQSSIINDLAYGRSIPPVPGIDYRVIVGTQAIPFTADLFAAGTANDGVLTPESGSTLGDVAFRNACENYYAINITHVDLDDHPTAIRVVQRILNEELAERNPNVALVGYNQYLRVHVDDCSPADSYFVIGRPIEEEETFDPSLCECGNRYCNAGETPENCPSDCARISLLTQSCVGILFAAYPLILVAGVLLMWRYGLRLLGRRRGRMSQMLLWLAQGALTVVAVLQPFSCGGPNVIILFAGGGFLLLTVLDSLPERKRGASVVGEASQTANGRPQTTNDRPQTTSRQAYVGLPAPKESFGERVERVRERLKRRVALWKEQRRLSKLSREFDSARPSSSVDKMIERLPDEVKRKLAKRKKK